MKTALVKTAVGAEPVRPEVVARADREDERDHRDERERSQDAAEPGAPLALGVEPARQKTSTVITVRNGSQSVSTLQRRPHWRDVVPVDECAQGERRVDAEDEPGEVEHDERRDAGHAPNRALQRQKRRRRTDVSELGGLEIVASEARGGLRRLRRRRVFGSHGPFHDTARSRYFGIRRKACQLGLRRPVAV